MMKSRPSHLSIVAAVNRLGAVSVRGLEAVGTVVTELVYRGG